MSLVHSEVWFDVLDWARGPGLSLAFWLMLGGLAVRVGEILRLGRKHNFARAKGRSILQGLKTIFTRSLPAPHLVRRAPAVHVGGWVFHLGFVCVLLFASAHIRVFENWFTVPWSKWPGEVVGLIALVTVAALLFVLVTRIAHPVRRRISTFGDYAAWVLTFLPLLTGLASAYDWLDAPALLKVVHVLSVEALMVLLPFTKLTHGLTTVLARYYNGSIQGFKGAKS